MTRELDFATLRNIPDGLEEEHLSNKVVHSSVHWGSIIKELEGSWIANGMWELKDTL